MVRHGQASFGKANYDNLSEKGRAQCRILADYLIRTGLSFQAVYAGDLSRQQDTAREVIKSYQANGLPPPDIRVMPEFNEYHSRDIMMAYIHDVASEDPTLSTDMEALYDDRRAFQHLFKTIIMRWISGEDDRPGVLSWRDFRDAVRVGLRKVMTENEQGKNILICTSGGPISVAVQMALDLTDENAFRIAWHIVNTSMTTFTYDDEEFALTSFNQRAHLELVNPAEWVTYW